jgi:hypothetical protein
MGFQIIEKAVRRLRQLDDEFLIEGVEVYLPIEVHNVDADPLLNGHIVQLTKSLLLSSPFVPSAQRSEEDFGGLNSTQTLPSTVNS